VTIKGWVDGFITEAMQTFCQLDACRAHSAHIVVAPPRARRILSNQTQVFDDRPRIKRKLSFQKTHGSSNKQFSENNLQNPL